MKKALFFSNQGLSILSLGMELEIAGRLMEEGWEVHVLTCHNCLDSCYFNPTHNLAGCAMCESRSQHFHGYIGLPAANRHRMHRFREVEEVVFPYFPDTRSLLEYTYEGINIGRGVVSSVVSLTRCNSISTDTHEALINLQLRAALQALLNARFYTDLIQPDVVYVYNGRFAEVFPFVNFCTEKSIPFFTLEMENSLFKYNAYPNNLPHSLQVFAQQMMESWQAAPPEQREAEAIAWFEAKRRGAQQTDKSYIGKQEKGALPAGFTTKQHNIAIFNSSEDELVSITEWQSSLIRGQNEAIEKIATYFLDRPDLHFYLRVHPNLSGVDNPQTQGIQAMNFPNLTVIPPESPVDTYTLMQACDKTVVFGSTAGIEATYMGRPAILLGHAFYESLGAVYHAEHWQQLYDWLGDLDLPAKDRELAYPYGFFIPNRGKPYQRLRWQGKGNSYFDGQKIKRFYPAFVWYLLAWLPKLPLWLRNHRILHGRALRLSDVMLLKAENKLPETF